jgi:hypothetical protein
MTNDLTYLSDEPEDGALLRASALAWLQPERLEEIAAAHGVDAAEIALVLTDPRGLATVAKETERQRQSGALLKTLALPALEKFLRRADAAMEDDEVSPATLTRLADTTLKISGLAEERAVALRQAADQPQRFVSLHVLGPGDPEPPPAVPNELRLTIIAPEALPERPVAGEVVDEQ